MILIICDKCGKKTNEEEAHRRVDLHAFDGAGANFDFDKHYDFCKTCWRDLKTANPLELWIEAGKRANKPPVVAMTKEELQEMDKPPSFRSHEFRCPYSPGYLVCPQSGSTTKTRTKRTPEQLDDFAEMVRKA